jgi:hypothetical protein
MERGRTGFRARIILKQDKYRRFDPFDRFADLGTQRDLRDLLEEFDQLRSGTSRRWGWNLRRRTSTSPVSIELGK